MCQYTVPKYWPAHLCANWPRSATMFYETLFSTISTMISAYLNKVPSISYTPKVFGKTVHSLISVTLYNSLFKLFPTMFFLQGWTFFVALFLQWHHLSHRICVSTYIFHLSNEKNLTIKSNSKFDLVSSNCSDFFPNWLICLI